MKINFLNNLRIFCRKACVESKTKVPQKPYILLAKNTNSDYKNASQTYFKLSDEKPVYFDVVEIKNTKDNSLLKIVRFKDISRKVFEKVFTTTYPDIKIQEHSIHRLYRTIVPETKKHKTTKGREIKVFERLANSNNPNKKLQSEKQFVMKETFKDGDRITLTISKVLSDLKNENKEFHTMTQYPSNERLYDTGLKKWIQRKNGEKKSYQLEIEKDISGYPHIKNITASNNFVTPKNDEYFAFRLYDSDDVRKPLTRKALKQEDFEKTNIEVDPFCQMVEKESLASFSFEDGLIEFNKNFAIKPSVVNSTFHEVKHVIQHRILGRAQKETYKFYQKCYDIFGPLKTHQEINYANQLYKDSLILQIDELPDKLYLQNSLEKEAIKYAQTKGKNYAKQAKELIEQFPKIIRDEL